MKIIQGGVTAAQGFQASGVEAGIKYSNRKDMALVYTQNPAQVAGVYTTNVVKAAPVLWDQSITNAKEPVHAVVLNSGIANACTGVEGVELNQWLASEVAHHLNIKEREVLTASTGVIGMQLRKEPMQKGVKLLVEALDTAKESANDAACAIMTTDTISKECAIEFEIDGTTVRIGGMTKGSGMIHPNMATMLAVFTTDAVISKELLQDILSADVKDSFNMISVDRDTSTNDTYVILANGVAGNKEILPGTDAAAKFAEALATVSVTLAKKMASDGEGATKLMELTVKGAKTKEDAIILSKSVITSPLVKTALYGSDANWGRILCALGYAGVSFDPEIVDVTINSQSGDLTLVSNGKATDYSEEVATQILSDEEVTITADMKIGSASATAWGCDLTYDYVKINGDYRS